ncbi:MAG TPA: hypothetical protein VH572_10830 [Gaiella sp.]
MGKKRIDPEVRAEWADARRRLGESLARSERLVEEWTSERARRRARLRRWSFGMLGR